MNANYNINESSFEQLFSSVERSLFITAYSILNNHADAQDAVQETAISAYLSMGKLKYIQYFKTWITRILINNCKRILHKRKKYILKDDFDHTSLFDDVNDDEIMIFQSISKLELKLKTVVLLKYFNDLHFNEIAQILKVPESTIKSRFYKALAILKDYIEGGVNNAGFNEY